MKRITYLNESKWFTGIHPPIGLEIPTTAPDANESLEIEMDEVDFEISLLESAESESIQVRRLISIIAKTLCVVCHSLNSVDYSVEWLGGEVSRTCENPGVHAYPQLAFGRGEGILGSAIDCSQRRSN